MSLNDELPFSKKKQLRDKLSTARMTAREILAGHAKVARLKRIAKQTASLTYGIERSNTSRSMQGWIEIGEKRFHMRSAWERNFARYLQWIKDNGEIKEWDYEPKRFDFPIKRGSNSFLPDFLVTENDGSRVWYEIKGYMAGKDRTKMKRFLDYYPEERLVIIDKDQYRSIARDCRKLINGWE